MVSNYRDNRPLDLTPRSSRLVYWTIAAAGRLDLSHAQRLRMPAVNINIFSGKTILSDGSTLSSMRSVHILHRVVHILRREVEGVGGITGLKGIDRIESGAGSECTALQKMHLELSLGNRWGAARRRRT